MTKERVIRETARVLSSTIVRCVGQLKLQVLRIDRHRVLASSPPCALSLLFMAFKMLLQIQLQIQLCSRCHMSLSILVRSCSTK